MNRRGFLGTTAWAGTGALLGQVKPGQPLKLPIRIGQIGTAHAHASGKWKTFHKYGELFEPVGLVEPDPERRRKASGLTSGYRGATWLTEPELLEKADVVVVETDIQDLVPTARRAVAAGKHLHLDKPGGFDLPGFAALMDEAKQARAVVQMGYMFRYNPAFQFLFRAVADGWLGEIREINGAIGKKASDGVRREIGRYPGGGMFELACHLIDAVVHLLGAPDSVDAHNRATRDDGVADNQLAVLGYDKAIATVRCNHVDPFGSPRRQFVVVGTEGTVEIRPLEPPKLRLMIDRKRGEFGRGVHEVELPKMAGRYDGEFKDLATVLTGKNEFAWSYGHDVAVQKAVLQASGMGLGR